MVAPAGGDDNDYDHAAERLKPDYHRLHQYARYENRQARDIYIVRHTFIDITTIRTRSILFSTETQATWFTQ